MPPGTKDSLEEGTDPTKKLQKGAKKVTRALQDKHGRKDWRTELLEGERRNGARRLGFFVAKGPMLSAPNATGISRRGVYF